MRSTYRSATFGIFLVIFLLLFAVEAARAGCQHVSANISAQNTFSDATGAFCLSGCGPYFNFSLSGTWSATVYLQRSYDGGTTWRDVQSFTANTEQTGYEPEAGVCYRFGVKTGGFTSGTVVGRISQ